MKKDYVPGHSIEFTASSPSLVEKFASYEIKVKNKQKCSIYYYKQKYRNVIETKGVAISTSQASLIFNKETESSYQTIIDKELDSVDQKKLSGYLW